MLRSERYRASDLFRADFQYAVTHKTSLAFREGESVFLKSNPEWPMEVVGVYEEGVMVLNEVSKTEAEFIIMPPQCLLQYKYAGMLVWKRRQLICLN